MNFGNHQDLQEEDFERAEPLFRQAIELEPRAKQAYNNLSAIYSRQDKLQQAREMHEKMNRVQEELASKKVTGSAGGGMVTVQATGKGEIISITIEDEVIDASEKDLLQDLISGAVNDALRKARELAKSEMSGLAGGVQIPGLTNMF